jgi:hypothetical protein
MINCTLTTLDLTRNPSLIGRSTNHRSPHGALSHGAETKLPASPRKVHKTCLISVLAGRVVFLFQTSLLSRRDHD